MTKDSIKPWAIRQSNVFKSLQTINKSFKIRKSNNWTDKSQQDNNKIRKSNNWVKQNKIGS